MPTCTCRFCRAVNPLGQKLPRKRDVDAHLRREANELLALQHAAADATGEQVLCTCFVCRQGDTVSARWISKTLALSHATHETMRVELEETFKRSQPAEDELLSRPIDHHVEPDLPQPLMPSLLEPSESSSSFPSSSSSSSCSSSSSYTKNVEIFDHPIVSNEDVLKTVIDKDDILFPTIDETMVNSKAEHLYNASSFDNDDHDNHDRNNMIERKYDDEGEDGNEQHYTIISDESDNESDDVRTGLHINNPLLDVDDDDDISVDKAMNARVIAELMTLRSKHKIPKRHIEEFLQVAHRSMGFSTKQHRSIPSTYAEVDKQFILSKAKYVKVKCSVHMHDRSTHHTIITVVLCI